MNRVLCLVTDPHLIGSRPLTEVVTAAVAGGVTMVQLRDKQSDDATLIRQVQSLRDAGIGVPLIVNDSVVAAAHADGVHLGQSDEDPVTARAALGPDAIVGLSVSDADQVRRADGLPAGTVDYLGVGPVWATATKTDAAAPLGPDGVRDLCRLTHRPMLAIGGIGPGRRTRSLRDVGLAGICVVSAICAAPDPSAAAAGLLADWTGERA